MKPAWDKLADEFKSSPNVAIHDVDCTAAGQDVCNKVGVKGYPTIKYYLADDPKAKDYNGGREFDALKKFVETTFKAGCNTDTKESCSADQIAVIDELKDKKIDEIKAYAKTKEDEANALKEKRLAHIEESKKLIKQLKKEETDLQTKQRTALKIVEKLEPPPKKEKKDEDSDKDEL